MIINTHPASILPFRTIFTLGSNPLFCVASNGTGLAFATTCFLGKGILVIVTEIFPRLYIRRVVTGAEFGASADELVIVIAIVTYGTRACC
jgi:hypothetical protein